jgi:hypothetical protein
MCVVGMPDTTPQRSSGAVAYSVAESLSGRRNMGRRGLHQTCVPRLLQDHRASLDEPHDDLRTSHFSEGGIVRSKTKTQSCPVSLGRSLAHVCSMWLCFFYVIMLRLEYRGTCPPPIRRLGCSRVNHRLFQCLRQNIIQYIEIKIVRLSS